MCVCFQLKVGAQAVYGDTSTAISASLLAAHIQYLASDSLKGRGNYSIELRKAADFIADQFKQSGLKVLSPLDGYFQPFTDKKIKKKIDSTLVTVVDPKIFLNNVIGVLPGSEKPGEIIIFSAHYDHIGKAGKGKGAIYPGANDNASGVAAILSLVRYYTARNDNKRTLIFCAFAGEELGLLGSTFLAKNFDPKAVITMINLEMLGRVGNLRNTFFITGANKSDLHRILRKNLEAEPVKIVKEPDLEKRLFERSDNYPFAKKGIPAHTIMNSDDDDPCYHQPCDTANRLDIENMVTVIEAVIKGMETIIDGTHTPTRIKRP